MTERVLIVSGASKSGKSVVSRILCDRYQFECCNIADLMASQLTPAPDERREIGPRFLAQFGVDGYAALLRTHTREGIVFDGLRLRAGLDAIAAVAQPLLIFKDGENGDPNYYGQDYDVPWLRTAADLVLGWTPAPSHLVDELTRALLPYELDQQRRLFG